jgi:DNA-binding LacI/PurR family transcriptional regulator
MRARVPRPTIEDVALEAGVHRSTVSRALTGSGPVSPENRARVLEAAKKLDYHPNTMAGALKSRRLTTWGLLSFWYLAPTSIDHYYAKILAGLLDAASRSGQRLLLENIVGRFDQTPGAMRFCHDASLAGVAVVAPRTTEAALADLKRLAIPSVLVAYRPRDPELSFVDLDNVAATRLLVEHLAAEGHRRIASVGGEIRLSANARDRHEGFLKGMGLAGLAVDKRLVLHRDFLPSFGAEAFEVMMGLPPGARPTAIVCATDRMALSVMEAAKRRGLVIPDDLAVAGVDDEPDAGAASLTTVHQPFYEIGARAGEVLRRLGDNSHAEPERVILAPRLVVRGSTRKGEQPRRTASTR